MLTEKDYCDYGLIVELEQLEMPIEIDFACGIENGQLVKTKFYPNPPSLYEAQKWLREEKKLVILVGFDFCPITSEIAYNWVIVMNGNTAKKSSYTYDYFEEALSEGIKEAIKILKEKQDE